MITSTYDSHNCSFYQSTFIMEQLSREEKKRCANAAEAEAAKIYCAIFFRREMRIYGRKKLKFLACFYLAVNRRFD